MTLKQFSIITVCLVFGHLLNAQVKIGENPETIDASSILELESTDKALIISRLSNTQMNTLVPLRGALIFNTDEQCVFYFDGNQWNNLCDDNNTVVANLALDGNDLVLTDSAGNEVEGNHRWSYCPNFFCRCHREF